MFTALAFVCLIGTGAEAQVQRTPLVPNINVCMMDAVCRARLELARAEAERAAELKAQAKPKPDTVIRGSLYDAPKAKADTTTKKFITVEKPDTAKTPTAAPKIIKIDTTRRVGGGLRPGLTMHFDTTLAIVDTTKAPIDSTQKAKADSVAAKKMPRLPTRHAFANRPFANKEDLARAIEADTNGDRKSLRVMPEVLRASLNKQFNLSLEHRADLAAHIRSLHEMGIPEGTELHLARLKDDGSVDYVGWKRKSHKGEKCLVNDTGLCELSLWCVNPNLDSTFHVSREPDLALMAEPRPSTSRTTPMASSGEYPRVREVATPPDSQVYHGLSAVAAAIEKAAKEKARKDSTAAAAIAEAIANQKRGYHYGKKSAISTILVVGGALICSNKKNHCFDWLKRPKQPDININVLVAESPMYGGRVVR